MSSVGTKRVVVDLDPALHDFMMRVKKKDGATIRSQISTLLRSEMRRSDGKDVQGGAGPEPLSEDEF